MNEKNKNYKLSFGGIMAAVSAVLALLLNALPFNTYFLLVLMSLIICIVVENIGCIYGLLTAAVTAVIMFLVTGLLTVTLSYVLVFGTYPVAKYLTESNIKSINAERWVKTVYYAIVGTMGVIFVLPLFIKSPLVSGFIDVLMMVGMVAAFIVLMWIYDIILTKAIYFYNVKFGRRFL